MAEGEVFDALDAAERGLVGELEDEDEEYQFSSLTRRSGRAVRNSAKEKRQKALERIKGGRLEEDSEEEADVALYDEVDEAEYNRIRQERMGDDDFIVDDDGDDMGYRDHGGEIWDEEDFQGESAAAKRARRSGGGGAAARRAKKLPKKRINKLFTGGGKSRLGASVISMDEEATVGADDDFLSSVLAENGDPEAPEEEEDEHAKLEEIRLRKKKRKGGLIAAVLHGTMDEARQAYIESPATEMPPSDVGSPGKVRRTPPSRPQFKTPPSSYASGRVPDADAGPVDFDEPPPMDMDDTPNPAPKAPKPPSPKKKKKKVVQMLTEEEIEEIENSTDGSKDHLRVSKPKLDAEDWKKVRRGTHEVQDEVKISTDVLPLVDGESEGEKVLKFFWLDAQQGENRTSDTVFLFGKVYSDEAEDYVSCCVSVKNVQRNLFLLPRKYHLDDEGDVTDKPVEMHDVYLEIQAMLLKHKVEAFGCKPVVRKYAFDKSEIPHEANWLKVIYSAKFPKVDAMEWSGKTFSHVLGSDVQPLERFIMKRDLMGPCWLDIKEATASKRSFSWCKLEADVEDPKHVKKSSDPPPSPHLVVLSLKMQTVLNRKSNSNELVVLSGLVHNQVNCDGPTPDVETGFSHFSAIRKLGDNPYPFDFDSRCKQSRGKTMEVCHSERQMLGFVMAKIARIDPDVIVGHNVLGFDLDVLLHRIKANNIPHWSRLGRLKRSNLPKLQHGPGGRANWQERAIAGGRLLVDMQTSSREFLRLTSYDMTSLVQTQLQRKRVDVDGEMIPAMYGQTDTLLQLVDHVEQDAWFVMTLMFKLHVLPLSKQITNITGGLLARTFAGGRSERNEYLLCHEFHRRKYIVPDKFKPKENKIGDAEDDDDDGSAKKKGPRRKKAEYAGGLVLEPKKGFYDKFILLLDFNSLYPSIILEYNLCFTTVKRGHLVADPESGSTPMADVPDAGLPAGILPKVVRQLVLKRRAVKDLMKKETNPAKITDYDIRQQALKLTVNSMYGCLGFTASRFHAKAIAALITSKGREILQKTVDLAQDTMNLDVIYGDTDSIMINTRCDDLKEVKKIGSQVKREVNALYTELEIEIDGVFKTMLLLKKKKYAALMIKENKKTGEITLEREAKGLDMVRRDWSAISHDVGYYILNQILSLESREDLVEACHEYLRQIAEDLRTPGKVPIDKFIIHKGLTKDPKDYADAKNQPHVQVALRMKAAGKSVKALDTIPYVVCLDGTSNGATNRAYHPDDVRKQAKDLEVDIDYYVKNQLHPVVARLLDPIDGTDSGQIAECLGLNPTEFLRVTSSYDTTHSDIGMGLMSQMSDEEKYRGVEKLQVMCQKCNTETEFPGVFRKRGDSDLQAGLLCNNSGCNGKFAPAYLCNKLTLEMRKWLKKYYLLELTCEDESCPVSSRTTRQLSVAGTRCVDPYCRGQMRPVYTDGQLYSQLSYYQYLFDVPHALKKLSDTTKEKGDMAVVGHTKDYEIVYNHVDKLLDQSARKHVDLGALFARLIFKD